MDVAIAISQGIGLAIACGFAALIPLAVGAAAASAGWLPGALDVYDDVALVVGAWIAGIAEAVAAPWLPAVVRLVLAAAGGAAAAELAVGDEVPIGPVVVGALLGFASAWVIGRLVAGALQRDGTRGGLGLIVGVIGLAAAGLALVPFVGYLYLPVLGWLALRTRRRDQGRFAGLRVLR